MRARRGTVLVVAVVGLMAGSGLAFDSAWASGAVEAPPPESCEPAGEPIELTSVEQTESFVAGTWIRCAGDPVPGAQVDDIGLEVTPDGRFYRVFELADGSLARATGPKQEGDWFVTDTTDMNGPGWYQVDWRYLGSGTWMNFPKFYDPSPDTDEPSVLHLSQSPQDAFYRRWTGAAPVTDQPPVTVGDCPALGEPIELTSEQQTLTLLTGTWIRCAGEPFPGAGVDDVGIDVTSDGRFYRLVRLPNGTLVRTIGFEHEGNVVVTDTTEMNGPGWYQVDWNLVDAGSPSSFPQFFAPSSDDDEPSMLHLRESPGDGYFVRWTGDPPISDPPVPTPGCGFTEVVEPSSIEQANELLIGTWTLCGGMTWMFGPRAAGEVGLELTADGRYYRLFHQPDGSVTRGGGTGLEGTWQAYFTELGNLQVDVQIGGLGIEYVVPTFFDSPVGLRMSAMGNVADYLREGEVPGPITTTTTPSTTPSTPPTTTTTIVASSGLPATGPDAITTLAASALLTGLVGFSLVVVAGTRRRDQRGISA